LKNVFALSARHVSGVRVHALRERFEFSFAATFAGFFFPTTFLPAGFFFGAVFFGAVFFAVDDARLRRANSAPTSSIQSTIDCS